MLDEDKQTARVIAIAVSVLFAGFCLIWYDFFVGSHLNRCLKRAQEYEQAIEACQKRGGKAVLKWFSCDDDVPRFYLAECRLHE